MKKWQLRQMSLKFSWLYNDALAIIVNDATPWYVTWQDIDMLVRWVMLEVLGGDKGVFLVALLKAHIR